MYQALLSRRYLLRKVIPLLAMLSVALCTAMVIIVLSVMGGFLNMVMQAGRVLIGDVAVQGTITGFPHYDELLEEIDRLPEVEAACATVEGFGLIKLPNRDVQGIQIVGIDGEAFDRVTGYSHTLFWRPINEDEIRDIEPKDWRHPENTRISEDPERKKLILERLAEQGISLKSADGGPGAVLGIEIYRGNERLKLGSYDIVGMPMPNREVTISVIPVTSEGGMVPEAESRVLTCVNEFSVGRYDVDSTQVFVPFDVLQSMLKMGAKELRTTPKLDEDGRPVLDEFGDPVFETIQSPARASRIIIKAADGISPEALKERINRVLDEMRERHSSMTYLEAKTWVEQIAGFIGAVKNETALVTTLFSIISMVSVFLVLAIFWTIVQQKTRDIGILRAVGASRVGIAWLFLRYGLVLGIVGVVLGALLAYTIVWNINPIHEFVGQVTGIYIWDPKVYYFNRLPNEINPLNALIIMAGGIVFAVLGALIPAIRAAFVDPVASLRYE